MYNLKPNHQETTDKPNSRGLPLNILPILFRKQKIIKGREASDQKTLKRHETTCNK
jgi:hypothetical protein